MVIKPLKIIMKNEQLTLLNILYLRKHIVYRSGAGSGLPSGAAAKANKVNEMSKGGTVLPPLVRGHCHD